MPHLPAMPGPPSVPITLALIALGLLVLSATFLRGALQRLRTGRWVAGGIRGLVIALCLALALLAGTIAAGIRGYRALTSEEVAAVVQTEPLGPQRFRATVTLADRRLAMYELAGDAFYVDAHILKWHPLVNLLGVPTAYEFDRVAGRYNDVAEERAKPHTVFALARPRLVNLFFIARRRLLGPLVEAEYGSGTFAAATQPATYEVRVSMSGLMLHRVATALETP